MDLLLLLIAALSAVLSGSWAQQEGSVCIKANAQSFGDCIQVAESCGWCGDENFLTVGESTSARCDDLESLKKRNCEDVNCRKENSTDICSNNGDFVCGTCECKKRDNPAEIYSGRYCECDNFNCDRSNNKLCGGHGRCDCRQCICDNNYTGSACDCSLETATCLANNGQICNGRGTCECGICRCTNHKFQGPTCEICPTCPGVCTEHKDCVLCRAFEAGEKKDTCERDCSYFQLIKVKGRDKMPDPTDQSFPLTHCKERHANNCWFYYTYAIRNDTKEVYVVETLDCPAGPEQDVRAIGL